MQQVVKHLMYLGGHDLLCGMMGVLTLVNGVLIANLGSKAGLLSVELARRGYVQLPNGRSPSSFLTLYLTSRQ